MPIVKRFVIDVSDEQLDFLEDLVNAHGWRVAIHEYIIDETYSALRAARPSLTMMYPDEADNE